MSETAKLRILIAEDYVDTAEMLRLLLTASDYEVHCAYDGQAALDLAEQIDPDVALVDIGLPRVDGYEVARQLRTRHAGRPRLLVALTGYGSQEEQRKAHAAGFDHHFQKPISVAQLKVLLKAWVATRMAAAART